MEITQIKPKLNIYPLLFGAFVGGALGFAASRYIVHQIGDEPGFMICSFFMFIAAIIAGGLGGVLLQELWRKTQGKVFHPIGFLVALGLFLYLTHFCYTIFMNAMDFRVRLNNTSAIYAIRNYKDEIFSFYSSQRRLPKNLEEIDKHTETRIASPAVKVEYAVVSNERNGFTLLTYHREGDREYLKRGMTSVIVTRPKGTTNWEPLLDRWGQPMEWNK